MVIVMESKLKTLWQRLDSLKHSRLNAKEKQCFEYAEETFNMLLDCYAEIVESGTENSFHVMIERHLLAVEQSQQAFYYNF
jgi:hypothetical protein